MMQIPRRPSCICKIACICADMPKSMVRTTLGLGILLHTYCNDMSTSIGMRANWANGALVFWQFGHYSSLLFECYCIRRPFARRKRKIIPLLYWRWVIENIQEMRFFFFLASNNTIFSGLLNRVLCH